MIVYRGLAQADVDNFVDEVLVKNAEWIPGSPEALRGSHVFVCVHGGTDKRCSACGPSLITSFKEIAGQYGQVSVRACSQMEGHMFAGHIIIFSSDDNGEVFGNWYGYVTPADVPVLLRSQIEQGEIMHNLWRGQLGLSEEDQKKALELKQKKLQLLDVNSSPEPIAQTGVHTVNRAAGNSSDPRVRLSQGNSMMFMIPDNFDGDATLTGYKLHNFSNAKELQDFIKKTKRWLSGKLSLALLQNGKLFAVQGKDVSDVEFTNSGAICVIEKGQLSEVVITNSLYSSSTTASLREHLPETSQVSDIKISKSEFGGNRWLRRKYSIVGDDAYLVLQWLPIKSDSEELQTKQKPRVKAKPTEEQVVMPARTEPESTDDFSIKNCILIARSIDELTVDEKARAYDIFRSEVNREIFICADEETRVVWLRRQMAMPD